MTMKKRFLGLALAAMVAVPATNAYAATDKTITGNDTETLSHNVTVTGAVSKSNGQAPAGRIEVELPTTMAFTVDQEGNFTGANYTVRNRSAVPVRLLVSEFRETDTQGGITLNNITSFDPTEKDRSNVAMSLDGNVDGSFTSVDLSQVASLNEPSILDVKAGDTGVLRLNGEAGTKKEGADALEANGTKEEFTLVFKIKKK